MNSFENIYFNFLLPFSELGEKKFENGRTIEYGYAPEVAEQAYMVELFSTLTNSELADLEAKLNSNIPSQYRDFLSTGSNGLILFYGYFSLYGYVKKNDRSMEAVPQPFPLDIPNIYERPANSKKNYFFIGGYRYDGSQLYIDTSTGKVHYCKMKDATSLYCWNSFDEMLESEIPRIISLFDKHGRIEGSKSKTLPV